MWLRAAVVLLFVAGAGLAEDWGALGRELDAALRKGEWDRIREAESRHGARLLAEGPGRDHYVPAICMARALAGARSLPYYERALRLHRIAHNLDFYAKQAQAAGEMKRARAFLKKIHALDDPAVVFPLSLAAGDAAYLAGRPKQARKHYEKAQRAVPPVAPEHAHADFARRVGNEYTYVQLYASPEGGHRYRYTVQPLLPWKLELCDGVPRRKGAFVFRMAALVVRQTKLWYNEGGRVVREAETLTDAELEQYRAAWRFAMDAIQMFSEGRVVVETEWIELEGVTLTGLTDNLWKGLVRQRHLDPEKLEPRPAKVFRKVVKENDGVVFVWPRGKAAQAFGGGPIQLPTKNGRLPARGGIRSMPPLTALCIHEFLHNVEGKVDVDPVHGPADTKTFARLGIRDEVDWYTHIVRSVKNWKRTRYR